MTTKQSGEHILKKILALIISVITLFSVSMLFACGGGDEFTVTFEANGGKLVGDTSLTQVVSDAEDIVEPKFERAGYEFTGWSVIISQIEKDTVVKAEWREKTYTISFDANGGTWGEGFSDNYTLTATYKKVVSGNFPTATKEGYKFEKWIIVSDDENLNGKTFSPTVEYDYTTDLKLKAGWIEIAKFTITYKDVNLDGLRTNFAENDADFSVPNPTKTGYIFTGWTGEGFTNQKDLLIKPSEMKKDLTFTATWQAKKYTVKLNANNGEELADIEVEFDKPITLPTVSKDDVEFISWKYNGIYLKTGDKWTYDDDDAEIIAVWANSITIKYSKKYIDANKGNWEVSFSSVPKELDTTLGVNFTDKLSKPDGISNYYIDEHHEYEFAYWAYKDKSGNYVKVKDGDAITINMADDGDITLYPVCKIAVWAGPY